MVVEALLGLITTLVVAQLGVSVLHERRLSRLEVQVNGNLTRILEQQQTQDEKLKGHNQKIDDLPCNQRGWTPQDCP